MTNDNENWWNFKLFGFPIFRFLSVPDIGYSRNVPDKGYSRNVPDKGYSRNVPDKGYFRNASCPLNLISTFIFNCSSRKCSRVYWFRYTVHLISNVSFDHFFLAFRISVKYIYTFYILLINQISTFSYISTCYITSQRNTHIALK